MNPYDKKVCTFSPWLLKSPVEATVILLASSYGYCDYYFCDYFYGLLGDYITTITRLTSPKARSVQGSPGVEGFSFFFRVWG